MIGKILLKPGKGEWNFFPILDYILKVKNNRDLDLFYSKCEDIKCILRKFSKKLFKKI